MKKCLIMLMPLMLILGFASMGFCAGQIVAVYTFDNDSGNTAKDVSGNGYNGVVKDAKYVDGKFGKAIEFDGTKSQVEIASKDALNFKGGSVTVEAWVKPANYNNSLGGVVQKWGDNSNRRQYLLCFVADKLSFYVSGKGNTWPSAAGKTAIKAGEWTHIAGTYDGKTIKAYINGKSDAETAGTEGIFASDLPAWIGGYGPDAEFGGNRHYAGVIDEVRFWSGALTDAEIQKNMSGPITPVDMMGKLTTKWGGIKTLD